MDILTQNRKRRWFVLLLLLAGLIAAMLSASRPEATTSPCSAVEQAQEWENSSTRPVPVYAAPSGSPDDIRRWLEPGESFRPLAVCGDWLKVPTWFDAEPVYVRVDDVERVRLRLEPAS